MLNSGAARNGVDFGQFPTDGERLACLLSSLENLSRLDFQKPVFSRESGYLYV